MVPQQIDGSDLSEEAVPVVNDLETVYGSVEDIVKTRIRYDNLCTQFTTLYGSRPDHFARSPGRVNLIGEHIDYEGYSVLPMAIRQDTIVAIRVVPFEEAQGSPPILRIANIDSSRFTSQKFDADPKQPVDTQNHTWANYFLCAYKGVYDYMEESGLYPTEMLALDVLVDGIVPTGAGLSSSAALVCSSSIAIIAALGLSLTKPQVAQLCCRCERHIGTQSGGMDQAISVMGRAGVAMLIDFDPIKATDVALPAGASLVVANSLGTSFKAETAAIYYNNRVVECRLAAMVLAVKLGMAAEEACYKIHTLRDVEGLCFAAPGVVREDKPLSLAEEILHSEPYLLEEVEELLERRLAEIFSASPPSLDVLRVAKGFKLQQRARHVYSEARRVSKFRKVATSIQAGCSGEEQELVLRELGSLMNDSHESCSQLYECSSAELEELVAICRENGALGSRLTGAGWGGCTVSLVPDSIVPSFISAVKDIFYKPRVAKGLISLDGLDSCVFASKPSSGAAIIRLWL